MLAIIIPFKGILTIPDSVSEFADQDWYILSSICSQNNVDNENNFNG